jgi:hypothetical protein
MTEFQCPFCDLKLEDDEESLAMHIEIGHILPNYIPISKIEALRDKVNSEEWRYGLEQKGFLDALDYLLKEKEKPE